MKTAFSSHRILSGLMGLSLIFGLCGSIHVIPRAEAGAMPEPFPIEMVAVTNPLSEILVPVDCGPARRKMGRVKQKVRLARRIQGNADRRRKLSRLGKKLAESKRQLARCLAAAPVPVIVSVPNDPDPANTAFGAVPYDFQIGKTEVTLYQYAAFLDAVAADEDTYGLRNVSMQITQNGSSPNFTYAPSVSGLRPVTHVSWFDAARFCNWLHNGMPSGAQVAGTTEQGAYNLNGANTNEIILREAGAQYWIPSENEWYKAAYHDPRDEADGGPPGDDHYWLYPTMSDDPPTAEAPAGGTNSANYSGGPGATTDVGAYLNSPSYYGTFDQGGNLYEWNDAVISGSFRGFRGGSWGSFEFVLRSSLRDNFGFPGSGVRQQRFSCRKSLALFT